MYSVWMTLCVTGVAQRQAEWGSRLARGAQKDGCVREQGAEGVMCGAVEVRAVERVQGETEERG